MDQLSLQRIVANNNNNNNNNILNSVEVDKMMKQQKQQRANLNRFIELHIEKLFLLLSIFRPSMSLKLNTEINNNNNNFSKSYLKRKQSKTNATTLNRFEQQLITLIQEAHHVFHDETTVPLVRSTTKVE